LIVGWQAPDTLGRRLVEGQREIKIFGEEYHREAEVVVLNGFSGHADHPGLLKWIGAIRKQRPRKVFLVHGESKASEALASGLRDDLRFQGDEVVIPTLHQEFTL
jgi:metallo-beta-lactamase family protein